MLVSQTLCSDDVVQICAHQMRHKVDVMKAFERIIWRENVEHRNHIFVAEMLQQAQFAIRSFRVDIRLERTR